MILLLLFAFFAGIVTILSPCILPILPIILSSSIGGKEIGKKRPLGIVLGFVISFTFFTLFLSTIVKVSNISADVLRVFSVVVIAGFGVSLLLPKFQLLLESFFSKVAGLVPLGNTQTGFFGGMLVGSSLGLLWTPCVGPILASVISLAITGTVTFDTFLITFAYSLGTALPMFLIMLGGQTALKKVPWLLTHTTHIQKIFGVIMILTAIGIFAQVDRKFQTYILDTFPQYGVGLTQFEDVPFIQQQLDRLFNGDGQKEEMGQALFQLSSPSAPELQPTGEWFNSSPLTLSQLKGKVVLIDFWTYSCINCQRTFPYLKTWWEKYKDDGLVIIGVHSPEFEFEKERDNLQKAITDFAIPYPVMQDNEFKTWRAYTNRYWPAKYFIDKKGVIRYTHFGEGAYDESEKVIQDLLNESAQSPISQSIENPSYEVYAKTPEIYLGYGRIQNFASEERIVANTTSTYTPAVPLPLHAVAYEGEWTVMEEYASPKKGAKLYLSFDAKEVYLVMRPKTQSAVVSVALDGKNDHLGKDVKNGKISVEKDTLYRVVSLPHPGRHVLELQFEDSDMEIFAFTFG